MSLQWASPPAPRKTESEKLMSKERERKNPIQIYLSDDEKYILDNKVAASGMRSISEFIRHLIIYGYVYDIDYKDLREYDKQLSIIGKNINPDEIRKDYETMQSRKYNLEKSYKTAEKEANGLNQKLTNITQYLENDISIKNTSRQPEL